MANIGDDLRRLLMAGLGAAATVTEKSKEWLDGMSKKGEEYGDSAKDVINEYARKGETVFEQGKCASEEAKRKLSEAFEAFKSHAQQMDIDDVLESLNGLTDEALYAIREKLDAYISSRAANTEDAPQPEPAPEAGEETPNTAETPEE